MNDPVNEILIAAPTDVDLVAEVIGEAFEPLLVAEWLVDEDAERRLVLEAHTRLWVQRALEVGGRVTVLRTGDAACITAAAVVFPVVHGTPPSPIGYDLALAQACGHWTPRFRRLDRVLASHRPPDGPHLHLAFLAVQPSHQRQGLGTALLTEIVQRFPLLPVSLEASSLGSRELYRRLGFVDDGDPLVLPDGPQLWPMWRPALGGMEP